MKGLLGTQVGTENLLFPLHLFARGSHKDSEDSRRWFKKKIYLVMVEATKSQYKDRLWTREQ